MENSQQQILSEIRFLMASVRSQLEELDAKIALWQQLVDPVEEAAIELDFDKSKYAFHSTEPSVDEIEEMPSEEQPAENTVEPELSVESTPESEPETESVLFTLYHVSLKVVFPCGKARHKGSVGLLHGDKQRIVEAVIMEF